MTGYGKAVVTYGEKKINAEVKSLNSKQLDLSVRIAPIYREREMDIRQMAANALVRGKVELSVWIEKDAGVDAAPVNGQLIENYYRQIKDIAARTGIPEPQDWFTTLLRMPDVTTRTDIEQLTDEEWAAASQAISGALDQLVEFRKQEGAARACALPDDTHTGEALREDAVRDVRAAEDYARGQGERPADSPRRQPYEAQHNAMEPRIV